MKKVYRFYKKPSEEALKANIELDIEDKYPLYALTADKKIAKEFMKTRNMDKFILMKSKMEDEEYAEFANSNNGCVLDMYTYEHYPSYPLKKGDPIETEEIEILSTWFERELVQSSIDEFFIDEMTDKTFDTFPFMLKSEFVEALETLEYLAFWKLGERHLAYVDYLTPEEYDFCDDYIYPTVYYDEVTKFIDLFGELMA